MGKLTVVLRLVDVAHPAVVRIDGVHAHGDGQNAALGELAPQRGRLAQLRGADGREIGRVREQHDPRIARPLVKADGAGSGVLGEVGGGIAESQGGHGTCSFNV